MAERTSSRGARKRGLKPAKRSHDYARLDLAEPSGNAGYALGLKFFVFSLAVFFFFFWFLLGTLLVLFIVLPALILAFGAALLLYVLFSLIGWARPLLEAIRWF